MAELPPGYRFYPTEEELICFYLRSKLDGRRSDIDRVIPVHRGALAGGEEPWFYFCRRQEREARGGRPSRTTPSGYWKAAGTPGWVYAADGRPIGSKKTMVFYRGRAPAGTKTEWKMNEYRALEDADDVAAPPPSHVVLQTRSAFSLCRLYTKTGCPRQFDRRPSAAGGGGRQNPPAPSSSTATLANVEETGKKRKRSTTENNDTSSSDGDGGRGHSRPQLLAQEEGISEGLVDAVDDWTEFLDWPLNF
ncbi:hypothetical protein EJB05_35757, partial [Eragrostis curvula]